MKQFLNIDEIIVNLQRKGKLTKVADCKCYVSPGAY